MQLFEKKMAMLEKMTAGRVAFLQTIGLVTYISLVGTLMFHANSIFGKTDKAFAPILFLTLFSFSALTCGSIVFGYPLYLLFIRDKKKEAFEVVFRTGCNLFVFLLLVLGLNIVFR